MRLLDIFYGKEFREELLSLIPLEGHTTGDVIFTKLEELLRLLSYSLSYERVNLIVTDGAPAMVGKHRGLVSRLKEHAPKCMDCTVSSIRVSFAPNSVVS